MEVAQAELHSESGSKYTGDLIERWRPESVELLKRLRADGYTVRALAERLRISPGAIQRLIHKHADAIADLKAQLAHRCLVGAGIAYDTCMDGLAAGKANPQQAAVTMGILVEQYQRLAGEATAIIRHESDRRPTPDQLADYIASLPEAPGIEIPPPPLPEPVGGGNVGGQNDPPPVMGGSAGQPLGEQSQPVDSEP